LLPALARRLRSSPRLRVVRLLIKTSPFSAVALAAFVVASAVMPVAVLAAMGQVVGRVPAAAREGLGSTAGHQLMDWLVVSVIVYALTLVLGPVQGAISSTVKVRLTYAMQDRLISAVSLPTGIAHLEDPGALDELELAHGQLSAYYPADAPVTLAVVVGNRLSGLIACGVLGAYRWWLGLGLLVLWLLVRRPLRKVVAEQAAAFNAKAGLMRRARYLQQLAVKPAGAKETRVFGLADWLIDRYKQQWTLGMATAWRMLRRYNIGVTRLGAVVLAAYIGAVSVIAYGAYHHSMSLTTLAILLPMLVASAEVGDISWNDVALEWQLTALPNLESLELRLARPEPGSARPQKLPPAVPERELRFESIAFAYPGAPTEVFSRLDLVIPAGRSTAIVGLNGAGKTTLVKLLTGLHEPTGGRITVDGTDLATLEPSEWQRRVAVVFQDFVRYPTTAADNIGFGAVEFRDNREATRAAAARAGALEMIESLPKGWDTVLSRQYEGGVDLSGGQWQRVALARALMAVAHGARVLALDEPTAWLDVRGEAEFFANFLELTAGLTTIIISHRFATVRRADRICVLEHGEAREVGSHDELVRAGGRYAKMFAAQASRFESEPER
jgi:ATP-binding cassette subfamily B protein